MTAPIVSSRTRAPKAKPAKPRKDYPLYPHGSGQWAKKVNGTTHYFGAWDDHIAAETRWLQECEALINGVDPNEYRKGESVGWLVDAFIEAKRKQRDRGEMTTRNLRDYEKATEYVIEHFGRSRSLVSLRVSDFNAYRQSLPETWGPTTVNSHLTRVRVLWKWANDNEVIEGQINYGPGLKRVAKDKVRKSIAGKPTKEFSAQEVHKLLASASVQLRAAIMLGLNCGYGIADCGLLAKDMIDWKRHCLNQHRNKTGIPREAWLWPETIAALKEAIDVRPSTKNEQLDKLVFLTKQRRPWYEDGSTSHPLSMAFRKLKMEVKCDQKGVGFYSLRHTFETVAGNSGDQIAVDFVMGHVDDSIRANYRHGIDPKRIKKVCEHVRKWFIAGKPKPKKKSG